MKTKKEVLETYTNSEEVALGRVGRELYEIVFRGYTKKQWEREPRELDPSVLARIPVRYTFENGYFSDPYQALPKEGYTKMCERMLSNPLIEVRVSTEYRATDYPEAALTFYTGPIDLYFAEKGLPALEYRSLRFELETVDQEYFQENSMVNYSDETVPWTRICEYKHLLGQVAPTTTIVKEYPSAVGEPYYPIPSKRNLDLYEQYKILAEEEEKKGIYFVGRLANYKYFNMDDAIKNALDLYEKLSKHN